MANKYYDIIIIGGGIAGLYSAYTIKHLSPSARILVLEKSKKSEVGGRANNDTFYGANIVTGAGIGRKGADPILFKLCKKLGVETSFHKSVMNYSEAITSKGSVDDTMKVTDKLMREYKTNPQLYKMLTFKQFAQKILGEKEYKTFVLMSGYTDYENADVSETLYNYGMDDTKGGWTMFYLSWKKLVDKLVDQIGLESFRFSQNIVGIKKVSADPVVFKIESESGIDFYCGKVVIATTIDATIKLVPGKSSSSIYKQIHGQPFLRLYAKFDKASTMILQKYVTAYTNVTGPLQKIIPMDAEKGVYMISYSDNKCARALKPYITNTQKNRNFIADLTEKALGIPNGELHIIALKAYYWEIGTHYYEPLKEPYTSRDEFVYKAQHPEVGVVVVGEAVSRHQGWVEGALESVNKAITSNWISGAT